MFFPVALSLGLLGSFHCVGMCGPIALALPLNRKNYLTMTTGGLAYNLGRVFTYSLIGLVFGLIGQGLFIAGYQNFLSVILGVFLLVSLIVGTLTLRSKTNSYAFRIVNGIKARFIPLFQKKSTGALFLIGSLNGLLPCGFVYLGLAGAMALGDAFKGSMFMVGFGLGTIPAMLAVNLLGGIIGTKLRNSIRKLSPVVIGLMAVILILRGLNLGIPYLSPELKEQKIEVVLENGEKNESTLIVPECCSKPKKKNEVKIDP